MSRFFPEVKTNFFELKGETIKNIEAINPEYNRTYDLYILVTCESGKRVLFHGGNPWRPDPDIEEMKRTTFFTPDEIAAKVRWEEEEGRQKKFEEYKRLKKELGLD